MYNGPNRNCGPVHAIQLLSTLLKAKRTTNSIIWTDEMLQQEALKYASKREFRQANDSAYKVAYNRGILNGICLQMNSNNSNNNRPSNKEQLMGHIRSLSNIDIEITRFQKQ